MNSRRTKQWSGHDWPGPDAQHAQYGNQGLDHITQGIAGVSLQNPHFVHGNRIQDDPYAQDGQYYQENSYSYPQQEAYPQREAYPPPENTYPSQEEPYSPPEEVYAQSEAYPGETSGGKQYPQGNQYSTIDQNNHYTPGSSSSSRQQPQHYSAQTAKGKSRPADPAPYNKPKGTRDKNRERDRKYEKDKSSSSRQNRARQGKAPAEEEYPQDDLPPFYTKPHEQEYSEQETANPDDSRPFDPTGIAASDTASGYDENYTTVHPISDEQQSAFEDLPAQEDPTDPYSDSNYSAARNAGSGSGSGPGSRRHRERRASLDDPYQPGISHESDLATVIAEADGYMPGSSSLAQGLSSDYSYPHEDAGGLQTPRAGTPRATLAPAAGLVSTVGQAELDERFTLEHSSRFSAGEVFKILWSEPLGSGRADMTDVETRSQYGQRFYIGIRRFIIIGTDEGHSTCVPILTYERRACTKRGVKPRTHGIIHPAGTKPRTLEGEPSLGCPPVRIELYYPAEKIVKESRVNYSKLVTVEHNIKVFFIGRITPQDLDRVNQAVDKCWEHKTKAPRDNRRRDHRSHYY